MEIRNRKHLKICASCDAKFEGRRNQKFCSSYCKNEYHNCRKRNLMEAEEVKEILFEEENYLYNYGVLKKAYQMLKTDAVEADEFTLRKLRKLGFNQDIKGFEFKHKLDECLIFGEFALNITTDYIGEPRSPLVKIDLVEDLYEQCWG